MVVVRRDATKRVPQTRGLFRSVEDCLSEYPALKMRDAIAASDRRPVRQVPLSVKIVRLIVR